MRERQQNEQVCAQYCQAQPRSQTHRDLTKEQREGLTVVTAGQLVLRISEKMYAQTLIVTGPNTRGVFSLFQLLICMGGNDLT